MSSLHYIAPVLAILNQAQATGDYLLAAALLAEQIETLLDECETATLTELLAAFPSALFHENRDLIYADGIFLARTGHNQEAIRRLERARFAYIATTPQYNQAVRCSLELARLYCSREHFQVAYHHLHTEVEPLLAQGLVTDPALAARFYLRMTEITPDIGLVHATATYARQALALYRDLNDSLGQFRALLRLIPTLHHQGEFAEVATTLTLAQECLIDLPASPLDRARLLNAELHFYWYRGLLPAALRLAEEYLALVERAPVSNFRVYAHMLLGNLHRELGHYAQAQQCYGTARQLTIDLDYPLYQPWVDAQEAWQALLQEEWEAARLDIYAALQTADLGQTMSFQVILAVLQIQECQLTVAERLLTDNNKVR